jgi:hypothetical protein
MGRFHQLLAVAVLSSSAPVALLGCPAGACFLEVCSGGSCRCSISSCGEGAAFDTKQRRCRCVKGYFDLAGQCLDQLQANAYCGAGYSYAPPAQGWAGGCVELTCRPGDKLDLKTGWCISKDELAKQAGVSLGQGQTLGCTAGEVLVVEGGSAACVPAEQSCAKDEYWAGQSCVKEPTCATGQKFDRAQARCVAYAQGGEEHVVDVHTWVASTYGPNGGTGAASFCSTLAKKPLSFGLSAGSSTIVRVKIDLAFPANEVARGVAQSSAVYDFSGNAVPPAGASEVASAVDSSFKALVSGGGRANAQQTTTTVRCGIVHGSKPVVVPESGGF